MVEPTKEKIINVRSRSFCLVFLLLLLLISFLFIYCTAYETIRHFVATFFFILKNCMQSNEQRIVISFYIFSCAFNNCIFTHKKKIYKMNGWCVFVCMWDGVLTKKRFIGICENNNKPHKH